MIRSPNQDQPEEGGSKGRLGLELSSSCTLLLCEDSM